MVGKTETEPRNRLPIYAGIIFLVLATYSSCLCAGFHADDWAHQSIPRTFTGPVDLFLPPPPFDTSFRPVFLAHLWLLSKISAVSIPLARLWTILIHSLSAILVFEIGLRLLPGRSVRGAFLGAAWFSVAFCHFEVPNALTNSETPGVLFLLLSVFFLAKDWPRPGWSGYTTILLFWALSLLSKEYALWVPICLLVAQWMQPASSRMPTAGLLFLEGVMIPLSLLFLFRFGALDRQAGDMALLLEPNLSLAGVGNLISGIVSLPLLDPLHPRWSHILENLPWVLPPVLWFVRGAFFILCLALFLVVWRGKTRGLGLCGLALVLCPLVLTCWLPGPPASRHVYLPSAGFGLWLAGVLVMHAKGNKMRARGWTVGLVVVLCFQAVGSWAVGIELARTTRLRERITKALSEGIVEVPPGALVILDGLPARARVGNSLPFLFPNRKFMEMTPRPTLKAQPIERLRSHPPSDKEAVVLVFDGTGFQSLSVSEYLAKEAAHPTSPNPGER